MASDMRRSGDRSLPHTLQQRLAKEFLPLPAPLPSDMMLCRFSHLFAGGYAAGYASQDSSSLRAVCAEKLVFESF